jgi:phage gpG-like protein
MDDRVVSRFLRETGDESERAFRRGMDGKHSGQRYRSKTKGWHRASAPMEYPAVDSSDLRGSIGTRQGRDTITIGTGMFYAKFLRYGTSKMRRRKMSDHALQEGMMKARKHLTRFVKWFRR